MEAARGTLTYYAVYMDFFYRFKRDTVRHLLAEKVDQVGSITEEVECGLEWANTYAFHAFTPRSNL